MLDWLLAVANAVFFHGGFVYAAVITVRQLHASKFIGSVPTDIPSTAATTILGCNAAVTLVAVLKLWLMLTALAALSLLGADFVPLFPELRVIAIFFILLASPATQQNMYDRLFEPVLLRLTSESGAGQRLRELISYVCVWAMRLNVALGVAIMNAMEHHNLLEPAAVREVLSGLVFTRRALQDVAARAELRAQVAKAMQARTIPFVASTSAALAANAAATPMRATAPLGYGAESVVTPTTTTAAVASPVITSASGGNAVPVSATTLNAFTGNPVVPPSTIPGLNVTPMSPLSEVTSLYAWRREQWQANPEAQLNAVQGTFLNSTSPLIATPTAAMPSSACVLSATEDASLRKRKKNSILF